MAVVVADTMKPKNNLDFPVVESSDVKGGIHCVENIAARDAILNSAKKQAGMLVYVAGTDGAQGVTYQLNDAADAFIAFTGTLSADQMQSILTYIETNLEQSIYTEIDSDSGYLELK